MAAAGREREQGERDRCKPHADSLPAVDFDLTAEQQAIQALAREFANAEIEPHASEWDRAHGFPRELLTELGELGLMGVCVPEEYGGAGADFVSYILVLEELSRADAGVGVTVAVHTSACSGPASCRRSREANGSAASRSPSPARGPTPERSSPVRTQTVTAGT